MDYLVNGWNKYNFFLSPNKLENILSEYHLVIINAHVPVDYTESSLQEYLSAYSSLYDLLFSGKKIGWERDYSLFLQRGITSDLANCIYGKLHRYEGKQYKRADFNEPVVGISPVTLWLNLGKIKCYIVPRPILILFVRNITWVCNCNIPKQSNIRSMADTNS